jgi:hypothetical protein
MSKPRRSITLHHASKGQLFAGNGTPLLAQTQQRNASCRCGSGRKAKNCCGVAGQYFNTKPNPEADAKLKAEGYKVDDRVGVSPDGNHLTKAE